MGGDQREGLTRFKDRPIRMFTRADGLPNNIPMTVLSRRDGSLWVGNNCGGLSVFDGRRFKTYDEKNGLLNSCVWSLAEGAGGELWVGTWRGGLFRFADDRFVQFAKPQGLAGDVVRTIAVSRDGSLWIATEGGLSHMRNGRFRNYTTVDGLSSDRVVNVYEDRDGGLWVGTSRGIDHKIGDRFAPVSSARQIFDPRYINIGADSFGHLYALSAPKGIDRIEGDHLVNVNHDLDLLSMATFQGDVFFSGGNGVFRIPGAVLTQTGRAADTPLDYASFGRADGMNSAQCSIGTPNMAIAADGKYWVSTVQGLAMFDLRQLSNSVGKPPIFVEGVTVGRTTQPAGQELVLPPGTHHAGLHFDSISLAWPEKIRFQYRMDDVDPVWLDADNLRTAVYTSIPVGRHTFRLRACNSSGAWEHFGISFAVIQERYFYETSWFRLAIATAFVLLLGGAFKVRLWQISTQMQARLDERVLERTRVARELHDTLLQTIQASKLMAASGLHDPSNAANMHGALERVSLWLGQAVEEAREALSSLRTSTTQRNDLAEALQHAGDECCRGAMGLAVTVRGGAREVRSFAMRSIGSDTRRFAMQPGTPEEAGWR